jgi:pantoate--beta-alanine ligase
MKRLDSLEKLDDFRQSVGTNSLGFVPTMGALHEGHLSLIRLAQEHCDLVLASIYVNPTQFNNPEDLAKYPNTLEADLAALEAQGCDAVFLPDAQMLYPEGLKSRVFDFGLLACTMEGKGRPGHFEGMATVVTKFFELVKPHKAFFGEKDFQQLSIVQQVVEQEQWPVEIVPGDIVREESGLAMSSRNLRLSAIERVAASNIYRVLTENANRVGDFESPEAWIEACVKEINRVEELEVEYVAICDVKTLQPVAELDPRIPARAFAAVMCGNVRLIDNVPLF